MPKIIPLVAESKQLIIPALADVIKLVRSKLATSSSPAESTRLLYNYLYAVQEQSMREKVFLAVQDPHVLCTVDQCRFPLKVGDPRSGRLFFDFNSHESGYDLAMMALKYKQIFTMNTLVREERASWLGHTRKIAQGSARVVGNGVTWFHKVLVLANLMHSGYKDDPSKHPLLQEYLQTLLQEFSDVLEQHEQLYKLRLLRSLKDYFLKPDVFSHCVLAFIDYFSPSGTEPDERYSQDAVASCAATYGLTKDSLVQRKRIITRLASGEISEDEWPAIKDFIKTRIKTSAIMHDRILFEDCLGNFSRIHIEACTESMLDLYVLGQTEQISYLFKSISKDGVRELLNYLFETISMDAIVRYMQSDHNEPPADPILLKEQGHVEAILSVIDLALASYGPFIEQIKYLYVSLETRLFDTDLSAKNINPIFHTTLYLLMTSTIFGELATIVPSEENLTAAETADLEFYPFLKRYYMGQLKGLSNKLLQLLQTKEQLDVEELTDFCNNFWLCYLYLMWLDFNQISLRFAVEKFQVMDLMLEKLFANQSKFPRLYQKLTEMLVDVNYLSSKSFEYFFKYRFGESRSIAKRIIIKEQLRVATKEMVCNTADYHQSVLAMIDGVHLPLDEQLDGALADKIESIHAQFDLINGLFGFSLDNAERVVKKERVHTYFVDYLFNRTPLASIIRNIAMREGLDVGDSLTAYLIALLMDTERAAKIDYDDLIEPLFFDGRSAHDSLLFFLFLYSSAERSELQNSKVINFMFTIFTAIANQFENLAERAPRFTALFDVLGQHRFFRMELGEVFGRIFFNRLPTRPLLPAVADHPEAEAMAAAALLSRPSAELAGAGVADGGEAMVSTAMPRPRKTGKGTGGGGKASALTRPVVSPSSMGRSHRAGTPQTTLSTLSASVDGLVASASGSLEDDSRSLTSGLSDGARELSPETRIAIGRLRRLRTVLSGAISELIGVLRARQEDYAVDSRQFDFYAQLIERLEQSHSASLVLRNKLKTFGIEASSLDDSLTIGPLAHQRLQHCQLLLIEIQQAQQKMDDCVAQADIESLIAMITIPELKIDELLRLHIQPLDLRVPVSILALFPGKAKGYVFGTALTLPHPKDVDMRLEWQDPTDSMAVIKDTVITGIMSVGFELAGEPNDTILGGFSISVKPSGSDSDRCDHKKIDIVVYAADPGRLRPPILHENSHAACSLDLSTEEIGCDEIHAASIINGTFSICEQAAEIADPTLIHRRKVHNLSTLMRAWFEANASRMRLDDRSMQLIATIQSHAGLASLRSHDYLLADAVRQMIVKHFAQFERSETFSIRTQMLMQFLTYLGINDIEDAAAVALKGVIETELYSCKPGARNLAIVEAYLDCCRGLGLPMHFERPLKQLVEAHFARFVEGEHYLLKTALLLGFCQKLGFRLIANKGAADTPCYVELLGVNTADSVIRFSDPLMSIDDFPAVLTFELSRKLLLANDSKRNKALFRLRDQQLSSGRLACSPSLLGHSPMRAIQAHTPAASAASSSGSGAESPHFFAARLPPVESRPAGGASSSKMQTSLGPPKV